MDHIHNCLLLVRKLFHKPGRCLSGVKILSLAQIHGNTAMEPCWIYFFLSCQKPIGHLFILDIIPLQAAVIERSAFDDMKKLLF